MRWLVKLMIRKWKHDVERNPQDYETIAVIGDAYGKLADYHTSIEYYNKAIALNPSYADAYLGLGCSYGFLHQAIEAQAALRKAVSLDPQNSFARGKLGSTLGRAGQYQEALTELREAVRLKPDSADAHFALGLAFFSLGDRRQAASEVDTLSRIDVRLAIRLQALVVKQICVGGDSPLPTETVQRPERQDLKVPERNRMTQQEQGVESDWLPKELVIKCDTLVTMYDKTYGYQCPQILWQPETVALVGLHKDLRTLVGSAAAAWKIICAVIVAATLVLILAAILNWWIAFALVPLFVAAIYFKRLLTKSCTLITAILLAFEVLVDDFAGWGARFPKARQEAGALVAGQTRLIDIYLKNQGELRPTLFGWFQPSGESDQESKQDQRDQPISSTGLEPRNF